MVSARPTKLFSTKQPHHRFSMNSVLLAHSLGPDPFWRCCFYTMFFQIGCDLHSFRVKHVFTSKAVLVQTVSPIFQGLSHSRKATAVSQPAFAMPIVVGSLSNLAESVIGAAVSLTQWSMVLTVVAVLLMFLSTHLPPYPVKVLGGSAESFKENREQNSFVAVVPLWTLRLLQLSSAPHFWISDDVGGVSFRCAVQLYQRGV